mmetsp:Transcript_92910/g.179189  ORF Transcript_92910/g.179189 Transcript_92910/m.179189 type:complete len:88 (+) Transcript_92910:118-381(+)
MQSSAARRADFNDSAVSGPGSEANIDNPRVLLEPCHATANKLPDLWGWFETAFMQSFLEAATLTVARHPAIHEDVNETSACPRGTMS